MPYELKKVGDNVFMNFLFFAHRFFKENLGTFISQMGNPLGGYESIYKVKNVKHLLLGEIWPPSDLSFYSDPTVPPPFSRSIVNYVKVANISLIFAQLEAL